MSSVRKEPAEGPHRERPENPVVPTAVIPGSLPVRLEAANTRPANGPVMVDSRSSHLVSSRPSQPTVRLHPNGSSRPSGGSASTTPTQATNVTSVSGTTEQSPSSRAQKRQSDDFRDTDLYRKLQASKKRRGPRPLSHHKPDSTGSTGNSGSTRAGTGVTDTDGESPSPMVNTAEPNHHGVSDRRNVPTMEVERAVTAAHPSPRVSMSYEPRGASPATPTIVPQNRKDLPRPSIASHSSSIPHRGTPNAAPTLPVAGTFYVPKTGPVVTESSRPSFANGPSQAAAKSTETHEVVAPPPVKRSERSPSFEILDQETFVQRTTPSKKRNLSTFPPNDTASPSNSARPVVPTKAPAATDLSGQEVELLNGIEEHAEAVPMDLLESLLEDEDMTSTAQEDKTASERATAPVATTTSANGSAKNGADPAGGIGGWKAPHISGWTDGKSHVQKHPGSLAEAMRGVANGSVNGQSLSSAAGSTTHSTAAAPHKTASTTAAALGEKYPTAVINLNLTVPPNSNKPAGCYSSGKTNGKAPIFKVPHPVDTSLKGKEPVRPRVPFERKASPPIPVVTTTDRQELWKKQALASNTGAMPKDVDSMLHNGHKDDDPFVVGKQGQNAEAGPSFKHPPVPESAYIHMLPEPRGSEGMTKDFDYRKFNEPLLDCINSLPEHAQNPSHIRVILEAYYSQSTLDRAPAIKIDGGEYDEYPPPEFKYSDEVYYSEKVPKPWLGKGCECVGPCSENSDCFCLKRQEMYFASYVTDPFAGPLKGFAHNDDGTLKDCQYPTWECGPQCDCPPACKNRVMQKGRSPKVQLEIYKTRKKGWGVRALSSFPKGTFVGLYSGEVIPEEETDARGEIYNAIERTYLFDLDHWHIKQPPENLATIDPAGAYIAQQAAAILQEEDEQSGADDDGSKGTTYNSFFTVDAFHWGFTRFFNHSCDPNLVLSAAYFDDFDVRKPRLAITAKKDIRKGDELCISYIGPPDDDELPPMMETDEQLKARTGTKDNGKRGVVKKRKGGTAHKQKASLTKTPEKVEVGRCHCGAKNCMGYMFNAYSNV